MNVRDLIERYNAAWNAQDLDAIDELHHADVVFHNRTADERAEGARRCASTSRGGVGRRRRLPAQGREDRAEGRVLVVAPSARTVSWSTSGRL